MTLPLHARPGHVTSDPAPSLPGRGATSPACAASSQVQAGAFLNVAAEREKSREAGKRMRQITEQQRAEMAREHVIYMAATYGIEV